MLYAIIFTACLVSNPVDCKTVEKRVYDLPVLPVAQQQAAQIIAAQWQSEHPARIVKPSTLRVRIVPLKSEEAA